MVSRTETARRLDVLRDGVTGCARCPELRAYCAEVAAAPRRAYAGQTYWGRPVPGFGDPRAWLLVVGLAPAAHGANRTGRMFTGDRSGDFLYAALHRAGLASQPTATDRDDGLVLRGAYVTAALRCAPPGNRPSRDQLERCRPHLSAELDALAAPVTLCLGRIAWDAAIATLRERGDAIPRPKPAFAHGAACPLERTVLLGCYHPSQQNTFTGRLTPEMIDRVLADARRRAGAAARGSG